jgi:hypothetical protein
MANYGDTNAWIWLTYGSDVLYLLCEGWSYDNDDPSAFVVDYPSRGHFGFTLNTEKVVVKLKNVYVTSEADWNTLKAQLKAAQEASSCTLKIKISSDPTYEKFDGTNDDMPVLIKSTKGRKKVFKGDTTYYQIGMIELIQSGALS